MPSVYQIMSSLHFSLHDLAPKKKYGKINLFDWNGDLSKSWYVYYSFENPDTGKLTRQNNIHGNINSFESIRGRKQAAKIIIDALKEMLENGFSPYAIPEEPVQQDESISAVKTIGQAIDFALKAGKTRYAESTYNDFSSRMKQFKKWLTGKNLHDTPVQSFTPIPILDYLNEVHERTSARNRNNTRLNISSLYKLLMSNHIVKINIVEDIDNLASKSAKNKSYSSEQEIELLELLDKKDPLLGLFIGFISMNMLRPVEVCRLKIEDINIKDKVLTVRTKTKASKIKIIPEMLLALLPDLKPYNQKDFLFTPTGPGQWVTNEVNKRNYFGKRFKEIKNALSLGKEYGMYSWRHTYITKIYRELRKDFPPFEAKSRLMLITGHTTMTALDMYLRDIDAELPEDYSHLMHDGVKTKNGK
ncbi:tyrosine-type recombinase/integrase [Flavobacterium sp. DG1-102-2]|uniref:tyrosine-type recombinase/integrase n=1 Tax=Flavobacterium sp. DG1-102-2 TaxID=3081663 RepID=UPI002949E1CE|nr:tyrosine-type recombinase/integrase [Flavobacterium sp. DG1-102-2]MDV6167908.1 tyrosine-type recombinase/integrase [Flavobacterium sp. DG1-102-2]